MLNENEFVLFFTLVGVGHLLCACLTWLRQDRWAAEAQRGKPFLRWCSGQRLLNVELTLGVFFLGLAVTLM
ncbi:hypothetical protein [Streptomyces sp. NPDC047315]|uniref:hypothetical protein n=1 Tax=Streptomyces sp. NPDC047315 TaxID=3155142 RepID=UPI0033FF661E